MQLLRSISTTSVTFLLLNILSTSFSQVTTSCNPTKVTCPDDLGLDNPAYFVDFTIAKSTRPDWTLASGAKIPFTQKGAELTFAKRHDAPTMWTNFKIFFGRVEFVVKAAPGTGIVSSMVLLSDDLDEIDWEFLGGKKGEVQTNYFGKGFTGTYNRSTTVPVADTQGIFHNYTLDWSTDALVWSIDGKVVRTLKAADADGNGSQYPQSPMKVSLSLWDAGDPHAPGTQEWAGGITPIPPPEPYTMYIKSVKIENRNPGKKYQYTDRSGSWKSIKVLKEEREVKSSVSSEKPSTETLGMFSSSGVASKPSTSSKLSSVTSSTTESTSAGPTFSASRGSSSVISTTSTSAHVSPTSTTSSSCSSAASTVGESSRTSSIPSSASSGHSTPPLVSTLSTSTSLAVCDSTTVTTNQSSHTDASAAKSSLAPSSSSPREPSTGTVASSNSLSNLSSTFSSVQKTHTVLSPSPSAPAPATVNSVSTSQSYSNVTSAFPVATSIASTSPILGPFTSSSLIPAPQPTSSQSTSPKITLTFSSSPPPPSSSTASSTISLSSHGFSSTPSGPTATGSESTADVIHPVSSTFLSVGSSGEITSTGDASTSALSATTSADPNAMTGSSASRANSDLSLSVQEPTSTSSSTLSVTRTTSRTSVVLITSGALATSTAAAVKLTSHANPSESTLASSSVTPFKGAADQSFGSLSGGRALAFGIIFALAMFI